MIKQIQLFRCTISNKTKCSKISYFFICNSKPHQDPKNQQHFTQKNTLELQAKTSTVSRNSGSLTVIFSLVPHEKQDKMKSTQ